MRRLLNDQRRTKLRRCQFHSAPQEVRTSDALHNIRMGAAYLSYLPVMFVLGGYDCDPNKYPGFSSLRLSWCRGAYSASAFASVDLRR